MPFKPDGHLARGAALGAVQGALEGRPLLGAIEGLLKAGVQAGAAAAGAPLTPDAVQATAAGVAATPIVQAHTDTIAAAAEAMPDPKSPLASKTIWFCLTGMIASVGTIAGLLHDGFQFADAEPILTAAAAIATFGGAIWGRVTAKRPIGK